MITDLKVKELLHYLSHRDPMVWIDRVIEVGDQYKELNGVCELISKDKALYKLSDKVLLGSAPVELTAQAYGYLKAAYQKIHKLNDPPQRTFLAGIRYCESHFSKFDFSSGHKLSIHVEVVKDIRPIVFIKGEIRSTSLQEPLARTEIQVFFE